MGEVIHYDFTKKRPLKKNQPENDLVKENEVDKKMGGEVSHYMKLMQFMLLGSMKELMRLNVSPTSLNQSREIVRGYTTDELFRWLEKTNENEWKKKAAFFQAIFNELISRLDLK